MKNEGGMAEVILIDDIEDLVSSPKPTSPAKTGGGEENGGRGVGGRGEGGGGAAAAASTAVFPLKETFEGHADAFHEVSEVEGEVEGEEGGEMGQDA